MQKTAKKLTKKQKIALGICLAPVAAFLLYLLVCACILWGQMLAQHLQVEAATGKAEGIARYEALQAAGVQTDHPLYSRQEAEEKPAKGAANLYYFPCDGGKKTKFVLVCPGGAYTSCEVEGEGFSTAAQLNELGYTAFVLEYRVGENGGGYPAVDHLAAAGRTILQRAGEFNVSPSGYALCGYSAGGNLIGLFGSEALGYPRYAGVEEPAALLMGYPWCNPAPATANLAKVMYYASLNASGYAGLLGEDASAVQIESMFLPGQVTASYPPAYIMHGTADWMVPPAANSDLLAAALAQSGVPYRYERAAGVHHGVAVGNGTAAEGWLARAVDFWQAQLC